MALYACHTVTPDYDRPARIIEPDQASRAALSFAVKQATGIDVTLADDALTGTSILTLEHSPPRTMSNPVPQGRIMEAPRQFRLVINGADCILVDQRDQTRYKLADTRCEAE